MRRYHRFIFLADVRIGLSVKQETGVTLDLKASVEEDLLRKSSFLLTYAGSSPNWTVDTSTFLMNYFPNNPLCIFWHLLTQGIIFTWHIDSTNPSVERSRWCWTSSFSLGLYLFRSCLLMGRLYPSLLPLLITLDLGGHIWDTPVVSIQHLSMADIPNQLRHSSPLSPPRVLGFPDRVLQGAMANPLEMALLLCIPAAACLCSLLRVICLKISYDCLAYKQTET